MAQRRARSRLPPQPSRLRRVRRLPRRRAGLLGLEPRAQRRAFPRRWPLPDRRPQRRGGAVHPPPPSRTLLPDRRLHGSARTVPGAGRVDPQRRLRRPPDRARDDRRDGRADGRRRRRPARRIASLAPPRRRLGHLHQRQRSVDACGTDRGDDGSLQPRAVRRQGARPRGRDPRPDDRALASGDRRSRRHPRRHPLHRLGADAARRCRSPQRPAPPRRRGRPPAAAARRRGGAGPAAVLAVVALRADAVRQRRRARRELEAALPGRPRAVRHPRRRPRRGASPRRRPAPLPTAGSARTAHPPAGSSACPALRPVRRPRRAVRCRRAAPATRRPHGGAVRRLVRERRGGSALGCVQCDMVPSEASTHGRRSRRQPSIQGR